MIWHYLIGHRYTITEARGMAFKTCRCGESFVLVEVVDRISGNVKESYWRRVENRKRGKS